MPDPFIHAFVRIYTHDRDAKVSGDAQKDSAYIRTYLCMLATWWSLTNESGLLCLDCPMYFYQSDVKNPKV